MFHSRHLRNLIFIIVDLSFFINVSLKLDLSSKLHIRQTYPWICFSTNYL